MDPSHLDELIQLEDSYWWHVAKRRLVSDLLRPGTLGDLRAYADQAVDITDTVIQRFNTAQ